MKTFTDQLGREVTIPFPPQRIISLVPSQTELLYDLGLGDRVVGITKFCIHPEEWFRNKKRVGGTKTVRMELVHRLEPDLIIANKEENQQEQIEALTRQYPVWISDIKDLSGAYDMIGQVGNITDTSGKALDMVQRIKAQFANLQLFNSKLNVAYFIWRKPYMLAGHGTYINHLLEEVCDFTNILQPIDGRYPEVIIEELAKTKLDLILLSSEPYPFKQQHIDELKQLFPDATIKLVDGEMFSWYGSRLLQVPGYLSGLLPKL